MYEWMGKICSAQKFWGMSVIEILVSEWAENCSLIFMEIEEFQITWIKKANIRECFFYLFFSFFGQKVLIFRKKCVKLHSKSDIF